MKKILTLTLISGLALVNLASYGMDPKDVKTKGEQATCAQTPRFIGTIPITPATIATLAPKAPAAVEQQIKDWFTSNPSVKRTALGYEPLIGPMKPFHVRTNELLQKIGTPNKSMCNYVVAAIAGYLIKIGGHVNRKESLNMMAGDFGRTYQWGRQLTPEDYQAFEKNLTESQFDKVTYYGTSKLMKTAPKTYQTVSRMAHYLLFQQAKTQGTIAPNMIAPEMYLVHIEGQPKAMSDRNYVIVEKQLDTLQDITWLTAQEAEGIRAVIKETGLFCCSKDNVKRDAQGNIVFVDFEQPNNSNPRHFFHTVEWVFKNNVNAGLEDLEKHFKAELSALQANPLYKA